MEFARVTTGSRACVLEIRVRSAGEGRSSVAIAYTYTALTPAGNAFLEAFTEERFLRDVQHWERSMNHFLETGTKLIEREGRHEEY